jgi:hypothetical protein
MEEPKFKIGNENIDKKESADSSETIAPETSDILETEEYVAYRAYADKFLNKMPFERLSEVQKELLKTLYYIDTWLKKIDEMTEGKGFVRSVFEQRNNLISQRIGILKQLAELQIKLIEEQEGEDVESIKDILA